MTPNFERIPVPPAPEKVYAWQNTSTWTVTVRIVTDTLAQAVMGLQPWEWIVRDGSGGYTRYTNADFHTMFRRIPAESNQPETPDSSSACSNPTPRTSSTPAQGKPVCASDFEGAGKLDITGGVPSEKFGETDGALAFLKRAADGTCRIVSSGDLTTLQIADAQVQRRFYVEPGGGLGWALLPWHLRTEKDASRDDSRTPAPAKVNDPAVAFQSRTQIEGCASDLPTPEAVANAINTKAWVRNLIVKALRERDLEHARRAQAPAFVVKLGVLPYILELRENYKAFNCGLTQGIEIARAAIVAAGGMVE